MSELKRVLKYASAYRVLIFFSITFAVISAILALYAPIIAGNVVDCIIGVGDIDFVKVKALLIRMGIVVPGVTVFRGSFSPRKVITRVLRQRGAHIGACPFNRKPHVDQLAFSH